MVDTWGCIKPFYIDFITNKTKDQNDTPLIIQIKNIPSSLSNIFVTTKDTEKYSFFSLQKITFMPADRLGKDLTFFSNK